ncbi:hypothetical protein G3I21_09125, partial [Streptomyces bauhiniae]|nr:hypothetical protein [Streptomyces bauhiniae]
MADVGVGETLLGAGLACAGCVAWVLNARHQGVRRARLLFASGGVVEAGPTPWERGVDELRRLHDRVGAEWWSLVAGLVPALLGASVIPVVAGAAGVPVLRRVGKARRARLARERRADAVIALCGVLAGEVRAGQQPGEALLRAERDSGGL